MLELSPDCETIELAEGQRLIYYPRLFSERADELYQQLLDEIDWRADRIKVYGREIWIPRLQAWHGEPGTDYTYSGLQMQALAWTPSLALIKQQVEATLSKTFNSVLANLYRDGNDSVSWHSDDEPELGELPNVASVTFGAQRNFQLRPKRKSERRKTVNLMLEHGSLLFMEPSVQFHWHHQIPKTKKPVQPRINLTYRQCRVRSSNTSVSE